MIKTLLFDWGNTLMIDFPEQKGPMYTWDRIAEVKNARKCLSQITKKYPCHIATNAKDSSSNDIYKALSRARLSQYITDIFCFKEIGYEKPTLHFFNAILHKLKLQPNEVVMIGDQLDKDFLGPIEAGLLAILFDPSCKYANYEPRVNDLIEIPEILKVM